MNEASYFNFNDCLMVVISRGDGKYVFYRANPACVAECCGQILRRFNLARPIGRC